ncbi:MAG: amidohydrolase [Clostridiales bacterium]|nr:amidohydrolase [Clostridiales bacterium]
MKIRFYNGKILKGTSLEMVKGELHTDGSKITYIGEVPKAGESFDREIDLEGDVIMPGFKNAHTHTAMTFARSLADNYALDDWLHKAIFPIEGKLTEDNIFWFTKLGYLEYLRSGITACFDMYFKPEGVVRAVKETGFRHVFCGSVNDFGGIDVLEEEYEKYNDVDPLISYRLGFHAEYTTSQDIMRRISDIAHKYEAPVFAHISETKAENEGCRQRYNMTPAKLFDSLGLYDFGGGGFHCVWFSDEDRKIYKEKGLYAVFNACSNLKLASGIAPVPAFIKDGINIAIGTDGAGSNNSLNMFREMYLDTVLSNVVNEDPLAVKPETILSAAVTGGARCMGLDECDCLEVGKTADIIRIDMKDPNMQPDNNFRRNLVYSGDPGNVKMTMINGNILYEDGKYLTYDAQEVYRVTNEMMGELIG